MQGPAIQGRMLIRTTSDGTTTTLYDLLKKKRTIIILNVVTAVSRRCSDWDSREAGDLVAMLPLFRFAGEVREHRV